MNGGIIKCLFKKARICITEIQKLCAIAEASINKTAQLQKEIAQIEAALSRKENQKDSEKSQNI